MTADFSQIRPRASVDLVNSPGKLRSFFDEMKRLKAVDPNGLSIQQRYKMIQSQHSVVPGNNSSLNQSFSGQSQSRPVLLDEIRREQSSRARGMTLDSSRTSREGTGFANDPGSEKRNHQRFYSDTTQNNSFFKEQNQHFMGAPVTEMSSVDRDLIERRFSAMNRKSLAPIGVNFSKDVHDVSSPKKYMSGQASQNVSHLHEEEVAERYLPHSVGSFAPNSHEKFEQDFQNNTEVYPERQHQARLREPKGQTVPHLKFDMKSNAPEVRASEQLENDQMVAHFHSNQDSSREPSRLKHESKETFEKDKRNTRSDTQFTDERQKTKEDTLKKFNQRKSVMITDEPPKVIPQSSLHEDGKTEKQPEAQKEHTDNSTKEPKQSASKTSKTSKQDSTPSKTSIDKKSINNESKSNTTVSKQETETAEKKPRAPTPPGTTRCEFCERTFASDRVERHQNACQARPRDKKRTVMDGSRFRVKGTEFEKFNKGI